ncbi:BREX-2 system adenine-specific DNA-methyltransferase PglX [Pseudomonas aeruginosa]|uniref:BREX-2 system adenine-specific DNA-methyltransferase PglX n=1 Tax=Pseudomonas aeruginosa TaxID=287 RepID=UPI002103395B|nr:BREX-2 system adenine-specific DNA-methyltransferase PglX [Pseudomonas aeruginosa]UTX28289.1 BREX-2 system adenine-specific DNA-methyltransferase PglX [Pseudomonas aeruginosa]
MHKDLPVINRADLLKNLQSLLPHVEKDILAYSESNAELSEHLQSEYRAAVEAERTAEHFVSWREAQITQAAVAWVLTCVFVRFLEDNGLLNEPVLAGPVSDAQGRNALQQAKERMVAYFNENPTFEERHYLLDLFAELEKYPVIAELLDHRHNPLWQIPVSADGAKRLIDFFQKIDADSGEILHDFTDREWDTRFLGDLYQDLSESVRKRYALLQTPEFVESFILDYTLEPAIQTFGLPGLRLIDPTCGSGHFLLTTFERVFNQWLKREPGTNTRELAQRALNVVHGTDINPYAIAICRFRLLIAAMKAAGSTKIKGAPDFHFNLACGDSLLHGRRFEWQGQGIQAGLLDEEKKHVYEVEDSGRLNKILGQRYHVVVGNPPYITVKDKALNQAYRDRYPTCHRKYSLGVPFTERFFDLAISTESNRPAGFIGLITANSFMKREFGKKLIEDYLPRKDLTHVIDTSVAYIPGHGTPTVVLFGRNQLPKSDCVRAVLGIRGETEVPENPALAKVWSSIVGLLPFGGSENEYVSVVDQDRSSFSCHPWSVGGGGASDLKELLEDEKELLSSRIDVIGFGAILGEDEAFVLPKGRVGEILTSSERRPMVDGEKVRNWMIEPASEVLFPYDSNMDFDISPSQYKYLWPLRGLLWLRNTFGDKTFKEAGRHFAEYHQIPRDRNKDPLSICYGEVATHNHFAFDREGKIFNRTAPVIKLRSDAAENDYLDILGFLNSSVACFWMKQVFYPKGGDHVGGEGARVRKTLWDERYQLAGTGMKKFPIAKDLGRNVLRIVEKIELVSREMSELRPSKIIGLKSAVGLESALHSAALRYKDCEYKLVALQEELDWCVYSLYGLTDSGYCYDGDLPAVRMGQRAFEIKMAKDLRVEGEGESNLIWFERHGYKPCPEIPSDFPRDYKELIKLRLEAMDVNPWIKILERPEYKRRWMEINWGEMLKAALKEFVLGRLEEMCGSAQLQTCAQLADRLRADNGTFEILKACSGEGFLDVQEFVIQLISENNVPQIACERLKHTAMPKFRAWQDIWAMQHDEDVIDIKYGVGRPLSGEDARDPEKKNKYDLALTKARLEKAEKVGEIPLPPQYKSADFRKPSYWSLRGKLDVPKERFFSLPGCEKGGDTTLVIGWAGLNHLQRAQAIAAWYLDRKEGEGWEAERLMPMLVALDELIPWLKQWHNEVDAEFGARMGDYYEGFLLEELRNLEITRADLLSWQPAAVAGKRGGRKKKVAEQN